MAMTRATRNALKHNVENEFVIMTDKLMHNDVADLAVNIHGILTVISSKYSNDAIIELIPELIHLFNRLDASLKVHEDLTNNLKEICKENDFLKEALYLEKQNRKATFEASLTLEEEAESEIFTLKSKIIFMESTNKELEKDILDKNEIIKTLKIDLEEQGQLLAESQDELKRLQTGRKEEPFIRPKVYCKQVSTEQQSGAAEIRNRFSPLTGSPEPEPESDPKILVVEAEVHHPRPRPRPRPCPLQRPRPKPCPLQNQTGQRIAQSAQSTKIKKRVLVLADSQGKSIYKHFDALRDDFEVVVFSKPGAKLKHIVREGRALFQDYTNHDVVIILAGSNDFGNHEPSQFTINQAMDDITSMNIGTNIIVNSVPYRHDSPYLNDEVFYANLAISNRLKDYRGITNLTYFDVSCILKRHHFTKQGLHYNMSGKRLLGKHFVNLITSQLVPDAPQSHTESTLCSPDTIQPCPSAADLTAAVREPELLPLSLPCLEESIFSTEDFPPLPPSPGLRISANVASAVSVSESDTAFLEEVQVSVAAP